MSEISPWTRGTSVGYTRGVSAKRDNGNNGRGRTSGKVSDGPSGLSIADYSPAGFRRLSVRPEGLSPELQLSRVLETLENVSIHCSSSVLIFFSSVYLKTSPLNPIYCRSAFPQDPPHRGSAQLLVNIFRLVCSGTNVSNV